MRPSPFKVEEGKGKNRKDAATMGVVKRLDAYQGLPLNEAMNIFQSRLLVSPGLL